MTKKIVAKYIDRGFGFPVVLEHVPMVQVRGKWTPALNYTHLARAVLRHPLVQRRGSPRTAP